MSRRNHYSVTSYGFVTGSPEGTDNWEDPEYTADESDSVFAWGIPDHLDVCPNIEGTELLANIRGVLLTLVRKDNKFYLPNGSLVTFEYNRDDEGGWVPVRIKSISDSEV